MDATKIRLSPEETELVIRADWILTKNNILQKVMHLLGSVQSEQRHYLQSVSSKLPEDILQTSAKISKGENYHGLPYLILDQPKYFSKENIFAIRHLFWWGNFFSSTLHLSGNYKIMYEKKIIQTFHSLNEAGFFVCINPDQWEHHFEEGNFIPINKLTADQFEETIRNNSFIKLSQKIPLEEWDKAEEKLSGIFRQYISMLSG